jgi:hypothetical protein
MARSDKRAVGGFDDWLHEINQVEAQNEFEGAIPILDFETPCDRPSRQFVRTLICREFLQKKVSD